MPRKSIVELSNSELKDLKNSLFRMLEGKDKQSISLFLEEFLTEEELIMLIKRLALYKMLYSNLPIKEIQQTLGISHETTRIYKYLAFTKSKEFRKVIEKSGK